MGPSEWLPLVQELAQTGMSLAEICREIGASNGYVGLTGEAATRSIGGVGFKALQALVAKRRAETKAISQGELPVADTALVKIPAAKLEEFEKLAKFAGIQFEVF